MAERHLGTFEAALLLMGVDIVTVGDLQAEVKNIPAVAVAVVLEAADMTVVADS